MYAYKITNLINGKAYIGITVLTVRHRFRRHIEDAKGGRSTMLLHRAMRKHGIENFAVEQLAEAASRCELLVLERALIAEHGTFHRSGRGYNRTLGGEGTAALQHGRRVRAILARKGRAQMADPEQRAKFLAGRRAWLESPEGKSHLSAHVRHLHTDKARRRNPALVAGRKLTAEHREKVGAASRGKKRTAEQRNKIAAALRGKPKSREAVEKQRLAVTGYKQTDAARRRISDGLRGKPKSEAHRQAIAEAARNASPEVRAKRAAAIRAAYARKKAAQEAAANQ